MQVAQCSSDSVFHRIDKFDRIAMLGGVQALAIYKAHERLVPIYRGGMSVDGSWDLIVGAAIRVFVRVTFSPVGDDVLRIQLPHHNLVGVMGDRFLAIVCLTSGHRVGKSIRGRLRSAIRDLEGVTSGDRPQLSMIRSG